MGEACSARYSPCLPWVRRYQLLPSRRACLADLEGPEPQGGRLGQLRPVGERTLWWAAPPPGTPSPLSSPSSSAQTPLGLTLHPSLLPSSTPKPPPLPPGGPHQPHLLWDHRCRECRGGRGVPGGPGNRGSHVLLGNLVHPGVETSWTSQAEAGRERRARETQGGRSGAGLVGGRGAVAGQDPGLRFCWDRQAEPLREATWEWPTGHSPWDPRGRELQLHQEHPEDQRRM